MKDVGNYYQLVINQMRRLKVVATTWQIFHWHDLFNALSDVADFYLIDNMWRSWRKKEYGEINLTPDVALDFFPHHALWGMRDVHEFIR